jgi:antitoxin component YwqK of YwqJK toxin-antitoxin module
MAVFTCCNCSQQQVTEETFESGKPRVKTLYRQWLLSSDKSAVKRLEYHFNGNLKLRTGLKQDLFHGPFRSWWQNGRLRSKGRHVLGKKEGTWRFFFEKAKALSSKGVYRDGKKEGHWEEYWPNGRKRSEGKFLQGKKTGTWYSWDSLTFLTGINSCFEVNDTGTFVSYYINGTVHRKYTCAKGKFNGPYSERASDSTLMVEGSYNNQHNKEGLWRTWYLNEAQASFRRYVNGLRQDTCLTWDSLGNLLSMGFFIRGTGTLRKYTPVRKLQAHEPYVAGKKHGEHITYYPSGSPSSSTLYRNDTSCEFTRWHQSTEGGKSVLAINGQFHKGKKHGIWNWYGKDGTLLERSNYVNGQRHGETRYFDAATGKLQRIQMYEKGVETTATLAPDLGRRE